MYAVLPRHEICWSWIGVAMISFSCLIIMPSEEQKVSIKSVAWPAVLHAVRSKCFNVANNFPVIKGVARQNCLMHN